MFDFNPGTASHMPFAAPDPEKDFAARQFCCVMVNGKWKIHQFKNGVWSRVNTGLPDDATECSPTAEFLFGSWHLTFIGGGAESSRMFRLYHICDLDGGQLPVRVCPADCGFLQKDTLVYADRSGPVVIEKPGRTFRAMFTDAEYFYRVSYDPFNPKRLLISGQLKTGEIFSRVFIPETRELWSLEADGEVAYKAAFWRNECFYAKRTGAEFEDREIVRASRFSLRKLNADELVTLESEPNDRRAMPVGEEL